MIYGKLDRRMNSFCLSMTWQCMNIGPSLSQYISFDNCSLFLISLITVGIPSQFCCILSVLVVFLSNNQRTRKEDVYSWSSNVFVPFIDNVFSTFWINFLRFSLLFVYKMFLLFQPVFHCTIYLQTGMSNEHHLFNRVNRVLLAKWNFDFSSSRAFHLMKGNHLVQDNLDIACWNFQTLLQTLQNGIFFVDHNVSLDCQMINIFK